mgnify:CR=1 FL=1|uniref:Uncharacterized protein n=1 Tax=Strombidinopsis acuminata TaxID=141414 RepID=A0A7S3VVF5_9SPIT|mmetsp:Transcript_17715/g.53494  ORF Transcript_17715/g.53494 Transcript_17715/m.53494 type:complete len:211 (+) Transcript_17715:36-668(+)|eukprot:scaffold279403_cov40-Tisochrysis_lutea.AAC.1
MRLPLPLGEALRSSAASLVALFVVTGQLHFTPILSTPIALAAPVPTQEELSRLPAGLARVDYLLGNWDRLTTVCGGISAGGALEDAQVVRTQNQNTCYKTPLKVQKYIGASSTLDPLFKADKLMIRATPLVADEGQEEYGNAVDLYIAKQQMSSTMAYTSSWSGIENPNGSKEQIEANLLEAKSEVVATQAALQTVVRLLGLPPAPPYSE